MKIRLSANCVPRLRISIVQMNPSNIHGSVINHIKVLFFLNSMFGLTLENLFKSFTILIDHGNKNE